MTFKRTNYVCMPFSGIVKSNPAAALGQVPDKEFMLRPIKLIETYPRSLDLTSLKGLKETLGQDKIAELSELISSTSVKILQTGYAGNLKIPGFCFWKPIDTDFFVLPDRNNNLERVLRSIQGSLEVFDFAYSLPPMENVGFSLRILFLLIQASKEKWLVSFYVQQIHMNVYHSIYKLSDEAKNEAGFPVDIDGELDACQTFLTQICLNKELALGEGVSENLFNSVQVLP